MRMVMMVIWLSTVFWRLAATALIAMNPDLTETISLLEVLWVAVNAAGAYLSMVNYFDAKASLNAAEEPPVDEVAVALARIFAFIQSRIALVQVGFGLVGLVSWGLPPTVGGEPARSILVLGLIGLAGILAYKSYRVKQLRHQALEALERELANGKAYNEADGRGLSRRVPGEDYIA